MHSKTKMIPVPLRPYSYTLLKSWHYWMMIKFPVKVTLLYCWPNNDAFLVRCEDRPYNGKTNGTGIRFSMFQAQIIF
jgi:hypothetical protein